MPKNSGFGVILHDFLDGPWEQARGFLKEELFQLSSVLRNKWGRAFDADGHLLPGAISGVSTPQVKFIANTGTGNLPTWEDELPLENLTAPTVDSILIGRGDTTPGDWQEITLGPGMTMTGTVLDAVAGSGGITQLTSDVTAGPGSGSQAATIANDAVTNAKAANMAQSTIKGRAVGAGTGDPTDLTATQATAILNSVVGDSGAGGTKGLVPAPGAGDTAAGKFLKADGTFAVPVGTGGDVFGPASSVASEIALYDGTTGKLIKRATGTGILRATSGVYGTPGNVVESEITLANNTTNDVSVTKHGFTPILPNDSTKFLNGVGGYTIPSGSGAPTNAQYVTLATDATLTVERVLTAGVGITLTDAGAGSTVTVASSIPLTNEGNSGTTKTIDFQSKPNGRHLLTLTGNVTLTLSNPIDGGVYVFLLDTGAGSFTVTWPASVLWPSATAPVITTTASKTDLVTLIFRSGTTKYIGSFNQNY